MFSNQQLLTNDLLRWLSGHETHSTYEESYIKLDGAKMQQLVTVNCLVKALRMFAGDLGNLQSSRTHIFVPWRKC